MTDFGVLGLMAAVGAVGYRIRGGLLQDPGQDPKWYNGTFTNRALFIIAMTLPFGVMVSWFGALLLFPLMYLSLSIRLYPWQYMFQGIEDVKSLAVRGMLGALPLTPVVFWYGSMLAVLLWFFSGLLMGPAYYFGQYLAKVFPARDPSLSKEDHGNNLSEYIYGAVFGLTMAATLLIIN